MTKDDLLHSLEKNYCNKKGAFEHRTAKIIRLFPYVTTNPSSAVEPDLASFYGVGGVVARNALRVKIGAKLDLGEFKLALESKVRTSKVDSLLDVIKTISFDQNGDVAPFALSAIPYVNFQKDNSTLRDLGHFLYDIFFLDNSNDQGLVDLRSYEHQNVLHSLIYKCLPELEVSPRDGKRSRYYKIDSQLDDVFQKDWEFMCENKSLLHSHYFDFLKLYSLLYQLRAAESLSLFFKETTLQPIYFTLKWESCGASRMAYQAGWRSIEWKISKLFAHVNCLEMLNHITPHGLDSPFSYKQFSEWLEGASEDSKIVFKDRLLDLIVFYKEKVSNLANGPKWEGWDAYGTFETKDYDEEIKNLVVTFFKMIDCQFQYTGRSPRAKNYSNWFLKFFTQNFSKSRGRLGYTLALDRDQILFITRLIVGGKTKVRLHDFWDDLECRGIAFDYESRRKIVELFERLNVLEKKSDSGDAQYVRALI